MDQKLLLQNLKRVEALANISRWGRFLNHPLNYIFVILHRTVFYRMLKKSIAVSANVFFRGKMHILLPASSDIFLTGGKSHHSEIRLARYIIKYLNPGNQFFDIGAHYGYFTLLAENITGSTGKVVAFEGSPTTFKILKQNAADNPNIEIFNNAVSDEDTTLIFYEFPNQYSEYNAMDVRQFENEGWYKSNLPEKVYINTIVLDAFITSYGWSPAMVKIDVEGAEFKVLNGFKSFLGTHKPVIIMEFLNENRGNEEHIRAEMLLLSLGYAAHLINSDGELTPISNASDYLQKHEIESDNIVYI